MKISIACVFVFGVICSGFSQSSQEDEVKATIIAFFEAFHKQDTLALRQMVKGDITMQSIGKNQGGETILSENKFGQFLQNIAGIPKERSFEEKISNYDIKVDGNMANAWTPYEFWFNGKFSHCGVNSFQLLKEQRQWKIIYLVDTRRTDNCVK